MSAIIQVPYATVCFTTCTDCMDHFITYLRHSDRYTFRGVKVNDLDNIYIEFLTDNIQNLVRFECCHDRVKDRFYFRGLLKMNLRRPIVEGINNYEDVNAIFKPTEETRRKLLQLRGFSES